jgi:transglutaminase-like putative cysteine protease
MLFHIKHVTRYTYSRPVFCEPFTLRLRPRENAWQRLIRYQLSIDPPAVGISEHLDAHGNCVTQCWFNVPTCTLTFVVTSVVETLHTNPFDFLLESGAVKLPFEYPAESRAVLDPFRSAASTDSRVAKLAAEISTDVQQDSVQFLPELARWISANCQQIVRPTGEPVAAETTLSQRQGSCRDLAVLFIDACRSIGLASRFVSGYQTTPEHDGHHHLHAWAETYLPGAGWRGWDPAQGLAIADQHVALASGITPPAAAPTVGTFRGTDATSSMDVQLVIRVAAADGAAAGMSQLQIQK